MKSKIEIYRGKNVAKWITRLCLDFIFWWSEQSKLKHKLTFKLLNNKYLPIGIPRVRGCFNDKLNAIWIGCRRVNINRAEWIQMLLRVLAHELIHYEHFRDGKQQTHQGFERRSNLLVAKFNRAYVYHISI